MITFVAPQFDLALLLAGVWVALVLAIAHLVFKAGYFYRHDLERPKAYAIGMGTVILGFAALYLLARGNDLQPIFDLCFLAAMAAIPTLGLRHLRKIKHLEDRVNDNDKRV